MTLKTQSTPRQADAMDYWSKRKAILVLLAYFKPLAHIGHMPHGAEGADAAEWLAGEVVNDH